jgi:adenosylcobyric acid synthase
MAFEAATQARECMSAKTLMIQGTGSGVGKSIITAALCRAFYREGHKVAPFKAQNMSLNSYVTEDGGEIGRAQVFQAEACGIAPHVTMNPILLKPSADNNSQVIVMGKVMGQRNAKDYYSDRPNFIKEVAGAFDSLKNQYELIVLEGAGSPAEINLRQHDMVNMAMAEMADAPVLIVGDIDRGGVFAWMKGTLDLLSEAEQKRVHGFIINQFRGDIDLLKPGIEQFEEMTGKPILGVIPFDAELFVDEEDAIPHHSSPLVSHGQGVIDVAIVQLPRIANFTDFSPLVSDPGVAVRYVRSPVQAGSPDLLILPGTKNTIGDMQFIQSMGWDTYIQCLHKEGGLILGICGGFQMMGTHLSDPYHIESKIEEIEGLGFIQATTVMDQEKVTRRRIIPTLTSSVFEAGLEVDGYEIHSGRTHFQKEYPLLFQPANGECSYSLGLSNEAGNVIGTYLHGFLDNDSIREAFLNYVRKKRNLPQPEEKFYYREFRSRQLERLADLVTQSIDMNEVKRIIGL